MGPAMLMAPSTVMAWVLPSLPRDSPLRVELKVQPEVENAPEKLIEAGSMRSAPIPLKVLLPGLGALFCSTRVPALRVVAPLYVLLAVSVSVPLPFLVRPVLPESVPEMVEALPTVIARLLIPDAEEPMERAPVPALICKDAPACQVAFPTE